MPLFDSLTRSPHFESMVSRRRQGNPNTLAWAIEAYSPGRQVNLWPKLKNLAMPSLWLGGELDHKYVDILGRGAGAAPDGDCVILPGCGHTCHVEDPAAVAAHIDAFLGRNVRPVG